MGLITCINRPLCFLAKQIILNKLNQGSLLTEHQDFRVSRRRQERPAWKWTGIKAVPENWEARLEIKGKKSLVARESGQCPMLEWIYPTLYRCSILCSIFKFLGGSVRLTYLDIPAHKLGRVGHVLCQVYMVCLYICLSPPCLSHEDAISLQKGISDF